MPRFALVRGGDVRIAQVGGTSRNHVALELYLPISPWAEDAVSVNHLSRDELKPPDALDRIPHLLRLTCRAKTDFFFLQKNRRIRRIVLLFSC